MNILEIAKNYLSNEVVGNVARTTGESESGISKVISAALPTVLGSLISKSSSNPGSVLDMVKGAAGSGILGNLGSLIGTNDTTATTGGFSIWNMIKNIFGDKLSSIVSMLAGFGGVKESTANNVLGLTSAAALGALGKHATEHNLDANGFASFLNSQKQNINAAIPSGFDFSKIAGLLGLGSIFGSVANATSHTNINRTTTPAGGTTYTREPKKGNNWLMPLLLLLAAIALGWWLMNKGCKKTDETAPVVDTTTHTTTTVTPADTTTTTTTTTVTKTVEEIDLNGVKLKGFKGGMEDNMITYLKSGQYKDATDESLKATWYSFDNVNFKMGSATELEPGSEGQIQNIAAILKAFPDAKIKIGGYTDKTGDAAKNKQLSQKRADFIKAELGKLGVGGQVTGAEGYGSEFATVPAEASDAERAVDRKMAVRFSKSK